MAGGKAPFLVSYSVQQKALSIRQKRCVNKKCTKSKFRWAFPTKRFVIDVIRQKRRFLLRFVEEESDNIKKSAFFCAFPSRIEKALRGKRSYITTREYSVSDVSI